VGKILGWEVEKSGQNSFLWNVLYYGAWDTWYVGTRGMCVKWWSGSMKGWKDLNEIRDLCLDRSIILKLLLQTRGAKVHIDRAAVKWLFTGLSHWGPDFKTRPVYVMLVVDHLVQRMASSRASVFCSRYHSLKDKKCYSSIVETTYTQQIAASLNKTL